jgi:hypothetical protein
MKLPQCYNVTRYLNHFYEWPMIGRSLFDFLQERNFFLCYNTHTFSGDHPVSYSMCKIRSPNPVLDLVQIKSECNSKYSAGVSCTFFLSSYTSLILMFVYCKQKSTATKLFSPDITRHSQKRILLILDQILKNKLSGSEEFRS